MKAFKIFSLLMALLVSICTCIHAANKPFIMRGKSGNVFIGRASVTTTTQQGWTDSDSYRFLYEMETTNVTSVLDTSGYNLDATNYGSVVQIEPGTNQNGRIEHASYFDTASTLRTTPVSLSTTTMSVTCWANFGASSENYALIGQWIAGGADLNFLLYIGEDASSGKLKFMIRQSNEGIISSPSSGICPINEWIHIACIADGAKLHLYTNAVECGTGTLYDGTIRNTATSVDIGSLKGAVYYMRGYLDNCTYTAYPRSLVNITNEFLYTNPTNNIRVR